MSPITTELEIIKLDVAIINFVNLKAGEIFNTLVLLIETMFLKDCVKG